MFLDSLGFMAFRGATSLPARTSPSIEIPTHPVGSPQLRDGESPGVHDALALIQCSCQIDPPPNLDDYTPMDVDQAEQPWVPSPPRPATPIDDNSMCLKLVLRPLLTWTVLRRNPSQPFNTKHYRRRIGSTGSAGRGGRHPSGDSPSKWKANQIL